MYNVFVHGHLVEHQNVLMLNYANNTPPYRHQWNILKTEKGVSNSNRLYTLRSVHQGRKSLSFTDCPTSCVLSPPLAPYPSFPIDHMILPIKQHKINKTPSIAIKFIDTEI